MKKYWNLNEKGIVRHDISAFSDNIEMSGKKVSAVVYYGTDEKGNLALSERIFYPTLRKIPNDTHATLRHDGGENAHITFTVNGEKIAEKPYEFEICGCLIIRSHDEENRISVCRTLYPTRDAGAFIEYVTVENITRKALDIKAHLYSSTEYSRGTKGVYILETESFQESDNTYFTVFSGRIASENKQKFNAAAELCERLDFRERVFSDSLVLQTPDENINREFDFAKLRISESIFDTMKGPMHCPGGQAYYAAVWANDEAEYAAPYYGFSGLSEGIEASINLMELYRPFMGPDMHPIPASIIAEGLDIWEAAGDEGDASMYLYGMTRFLLETGDRKLCEKYFDTIDWCVKYIETKETDDHVITSDCDELEARFKIGNANLLTNSLSYGGLTKAASLARSLGYYDKAKKYKDFAERLKEGIENHFGAQFKGYNTYVYYQGCDIFRSYICAPLTVGIEDRAEETAKALIENLLCENGFLTAEGDTMYWDRSTLYAFRGFFQSGLTDRVFDLFKDYTAARLTGTHVPYPVESWPEGHGRHLSAESGLYARAIIEGIFGIEPTGLNSFVLKPSLPEEWMGKTCSLKKIHAFDKIFDIVITRNTSDYSVVVNGFNSVIPMGGSQEFVL